MQTKTAIVYARVSTAKQAAEELPIEGQIEQCRAKAAALGAEVVRVFVDAGISGRDEDRPGFQDAIAYCEAEQVDYYITWSTSRFARDFVTAGFYKRRLVKRGVDLVYCTMDMGDPSSNSAFILDGVTALFDELYSRQVAIDTTRSMMKNARDGFFNGGRTPYGYSPAPSPKDARRRTLVPNPQEAWIVNQIFNWRLAGSGTRTICEQLNSAGHTHRGKPWSATSVGFILAAPAAVGMTRFNRRRSDGKGLKPQSEWVSVKSHEPIVAAEIWDSVQAMQPAVSKPKGSPLSTHLFTGLLRCGACGGALHVETATGKSKAYSYYNCGTWLKTRQCRSIRRSSSHVDDFLLTTILEKVFTPDVMREVAADLNAECGRWAIEQKASVKAVEAQIRTATARKANLMDLLELHGREAPNLGDLTERLQELSRQIKDLKGQVDKLMQEKAPAFELDEADLQTINSSLLTIIGDRSDVKRARALLQSLIDSVVLDSEHAEINYTTALLASGTKQVVGVHSSEKWLPE